MGGLGGNNGHLNHLYEDYNLTFGEMKKILRDLSNNKITLYEKVDGQNLSLSYNPKTHAPMAARNKSDIKSQGITLSKVRERYHNKPGVMNAFSDAMSAFNEAIRKLTYYQRFQIFDPAIGGMPFVNSEVMSTKNPNIIRYDGNYLVMHSLSRFSNPHRGNICHETFDSIVSEIDQLEVIVDDQIWQIFGPKTIDLSESMNRNDMMKSLGKIDDLITSWGLDDQSTVRDFLIKYVFTMHASDLILDIDSRLSLESRMLDERGALPTPSIVKNLSDSQKLTVKRLTKDRKVLIREALVPIEMIINDFGLALLENSHSSFVSSGHDQVRNLRTRVDNAIKELSKSADPSLRSKLDLNWTKLKKTSDTITSTVEGVVFTINETSYKVTGAFAPMNQILGWVNPSFSHSRGKASESPLPIFVG
jgi:hypothetical protein